MPPVLFVITISVWTRAHRGLGPGAAGWCGASGGGCSLCCWRRRAVLVVWGDGLPLSDAVAGKSKSVEVCIA